MKDNKGRFIRVYSKLDKKCPCGSLFVTTEGRVLQGKGKYCSKKCFFEYRSVTSGENHHAWKGEDVGYHAIHNWIARKLGKPSQCEECHTKESKRFEWANISGEYKRDTNDWKRLSIECHHKFDNIAARGWATKRRQKCYA